MSPGTPRVGQWRLLYLLIALVVLLLSYPFAGRGGPLGVAAVLIPIASVHALATQRRHRAIPSVLGAVTVAGVVQQAAGAELLPLLVVGGSTLLLYAYTTIFVLSHVLRSERVTGDTICGAIAVYLMIGATWTFACIMLEHLQPGSFQPAAGARPATRQDLLYFSYVTLATLGYEDVVPATDRARSLAVMEGLFGTIYMAILVARLIGLHLVHSKPSR